MGEGGRGGHVGSSGRGSGLRGAGGDGRQGPGGTLQEGGDTDHFTHQQTSEKETPNIQSGPTRGDQ